MLEWFRKKKRIITRFEIAKLELRKGDILFLIPKENIDPCVLDEIAEDLEFHFREVEPTVRVIMSTFPLNGWLIRKEIEKKER